MMQRGGSNYSWWWASHIRTRQSKWLEQNLQDMEEKVKTMLKLIEEDGDSFAKRAEMYYRKRPELINFVEEFFRGYRALAERYDHISGELHSANNTIATVFPDQVKFPIDEEDLKIPPEIDPNKFCNGLPETPQLMNSMKIDAEIPKFPNQLGEMMRSSGMDRDTVEEIERIEKNILVLQAEKEIVKNSYEAGLAKFWEIEKQVMELQEKARCLQEGFEFGSSIKEEEAEALMVATALKSCGETLARLQEQQQRSEDEAKIESKRIQNAEDKLEILKGEFILSETEFDKLIDEAAVAGTNITNLEDEISNVKQERLELQEICRKIREQFQLDSDKSLYVPEIGEKIDELVNKVSGIETLVLSQTAQITRLRSETDELQKHLQSLEDEKLELVNESEKLDKIRDLEGKLQAVQDLYCCIVDQKNQLQNNLSKACHNLDVLAEKLLGSEMQEEKTDTHLVETGSENKNPLKFESDEKITDHEQSFESEKREPKAIDQPENSAPFLDLQKPSIEQVLSFESWKKNIEFEEPKLIKGRTDPNERTMIVGSDEQNPNLEEGVLNGESEKQSKEPEQSVTDFESWKKNIEFEEPKLEKGRTDANERTMIVESDEKNPNREESVINGESEKQSKEPEDLENLHLLLLDHLEDREKILLSEYTAILRNYKETKRKLSDIEKQNEETQIATMAEIRDLKSSNAMKDGEIQLLRQKMNLLRLHSDEIPEPDELDQIVNKSKTPFYRLETETNQSDPEVQTFQNQRQKKRSRWYFLTRRALFRRSKRHSEEALASSG